MIFSFFLSILYHNYFFKSREDYHYMNIEKWIKRNDKLRTNSMRFLNNGRREYLLANFEGTKQSADIKKRSPMLYAKDFFRVKTNVKSWDPEIMKSKGKDPVDFKNNSEVFDSLRNEFDIPYWALTSMVGGPLVDYNNAFTYQMKTCNVNCPWCFVDNKNKNGKKGKGDYFSIKEIMNVFEEERKDKPLNMIRSSGGEPTIAIEQWYEILRELEKRDGLVDKVALWGDTNLMTGHFIDYLEHEGLIEKNIREKIGQYKNPQILCSFKGTDTESFLKSTGFIKKDKGKAMLDERGNTVADKRYSFLDEERWYSFRKMVESGIDVYPFIYDPNPDTLEDFLDEGARRFGDGFYLKTWAFKLGSYGPAPQRYINLGLDPEKEQQKLDDNFKKSEEILQDLIYKKFKLNYKAVPRSGIPLEIQK